MGKLFQNQKFQNTMFFFATITSVIYLLWRLIFTLPFQEGPIALIFGIMLLISEISAAFGTYELYWRKKRANKVDLTRPEIPASWYPDVDVIVAGGEAHVLEVNPRFGGGYPLAYACGCNYPAFILENLQERANPPGATEYREHVLMMKHDTVMIRQMP